MSGTLLLVDDNSESLTSLNFAFSRSDYRVVAAEGGEKALDALDHGPVDVIVTDLKMPGVDGMQVLRRAMSLESPPAVILLTAFATVENAVEAMHEGAFHYLTKPVNLKDLRAQVERAMDHQRLRKENRQLREALDERFGFEGMIGESVEIMDLINKVKLIAGSRATVLIQGESGTGKELIARAIHFNGPRRRKPFVALHCAAIAETLLESELFGHEKGAFTGAIGRQEGRFMQADGGTLFLDEIGEVPLSMQVKLLRVLETWEFRRVGGNDPIKVDVRLVAATNRDLAKDVETGSFREDLFYRLNVVTLETPPLRRRPSDIPLLVRHFVDRFAKENSREAPKVDSQAMSALRTYHWPGNIRELRNVMENVMVFLENGTIDLDQLPPQIRGAGPDAAAPSGGLGIGQTLEEAEAYLIRQTLAAQGGNRTRAAETLGISRRTLQRKIKELRLD